MTIVLATLQEADAQRCADAIRVTAPASATMQGAAGAICRWLYDELTDSRGGRACAMVRCYLTQPYGALPADLQRFAKRALGAVAITPPEPGMRCLTLLATVGDEPAWNDRRLSQGHQAIPLPSPHIVERAPMIAQLIRELGLDIASVIRPVGGRPPAGAASTEGVFHVEDAVGSPFIPAQQGFVDRYGIRSVVGFGGLLPSSSELFAVIVFSRDHVPVVTADAFRTVAGEIGRVLAARQAVFDEAPATAA